MTNREASERFVLVWEHAANVQEVAILCKMTERAASNKAAGLRRKGVMLKRMKNTGGPGKPSNCLTHEDIDDLKLIVEKIQGAREVERRYRQAK